MSATAVADAVASIRAVTPRVEEAVAGIVLGDCLDLFADDLAGWAEALNARSVALGATWTPTRRSSTPTEWAIRCFRHWWFHAGRHGCYLPVPEPRPSATRRAAA